MASSSPEAGLRLPRGGVQGSDVHSTHHGNVGDWSEALWPFLRIVSGMFSASPQSPPRTLLMRPPWVYHPCESVFFSIHCGAEYLACLASGLVNEWVNYCISRRNKSVTHSTSPGVVPLGGLRLLLVQGVTSHGISWIAEIFSKAFSKVYDLETRIYMSTFSENLARQRGEDRVWYTQMDSC